MNPNSEYRRLAAIMFTDMVGYSTLSQRNEKLAQELLEEHRALLRTLFPKFNGTEIKTIGDAFLVEFHSALEAAQCAIEIQRALAKRNPDVAADRRIEIKIGIHIGDVVHRGGDVYGDGVNIASRIEPLAGAGGICVSMDVERQIRNALEARFEKLAPTELKNISVAMDLFRIVLPWKQQPSIAKTRDLHRQKPKLVVFFAAAAFVLLCLNLGAWFLNHARNSNSTRLSAANGPPQATPALELKSIAVLPFVNMSADKADEYLSDGMTEELLNKLANVPGLRVPGRSSCFAFKGKTEENIFRKVGDQLHVTTVLEGSVRKAGDKLRITAQLINVSDGFHLWSKTYDRNMKDILSVQSNVAQQVVQAMQVKLGVEATRSLAKAPTVNPEAHRLYLLGRYHFGKNTRTSLTKALQYFNQTLKKDPSFALAYCGLADCYSWAGGNLWPGKETWAKQKELAQKALALDPNLAEARLSLGIALIDAFEWRDGEEQIKHAMAENPRLPLAYDQLSYINAAFGRFDEAISLQKRAIELDPFSAMFNLSLCWRLYAARRYDEAIAQARKTLELDPSFAFSYSVLGYCFLGKGDIASAIAAFQKEKALDPSLFPAFDLAHAYARTGNRVQAEKMLLAWDIHAKQRFLSPATRVYLYLGLGEKGKALDWLQKCYEEQDGYCGGLKVDRIFDPLRGEPRFQALLKKVGLDK